MYKKCEEILNDLENQGKIKKLDFTFPSKQELKLKLKDILEDSVDEKYYLSDEQVNKIKYKLNEENVLLGGMQEHQSIKKDGICTTLTSSMGCGGGYVPMVTRKYGIFDTEKQTHQAGSVYDENGLAPTLDTMQGGWRQPCIEEKGFVQNKYEEFIEKHGYIPKMFNPYNKKEIKDVAPTQSTYCGSMTSSATILIKNNTKQGYLEATDGDGCYITNIDKKRGTVQKEMIPTLKTSLDIGCVTNHLRIRKLTPKECWRLMGFDDEDFEKAEKVNSNTQLYKQAGNSIVVNVLEAIFKELFNNRLWSDLD